MAQPTLWWLLAGIAVTVELLSGTFYLLMIAIGFCAGAVAAHLGYGPVAQMLSAAVVAGGAVVGWHTQRDRRHAELPAQANVNVILDIGETVQVNGWNTDGTAQVQYRGANWTVMHRAGVPPVVGQYRVAEVIGSRLLVDKS